MLYPPVLHGALTSSLGAETWFQFGKVIYLQVSRQCRREREMLKLVAVFLFRAT